MGVARWRENDRTDHELAGAFLVLFGLLASLVAGVLLVAAVNPGYQRQWYLLQGGVPIALLALGLMCWSVWLMRFRLRVATVAAVLALCIATGLVLGGGYWDLPDRSAAEARNVAAFNQIAAFPGAKLVNTVTLGTGVDGDIFGEGFLNPPKDYFTEQMFVLPPGTTVAHALAFYVATFRGYGWKVTRENTYCADGYLLIDGPCVVLTANGYHVNVLKHHGRVKVILS